MRSDQLTRYQRHALKNKLTPMLGYLTRLRRRMVHRGFQMGDELLDAVARAEIAVHDLRNVTHYLACGDVIHRQQRDDNQSD